MKEFEDIALLLRNKYDIIVLDLIETRANISGFPCRHDVMGSIHSFVIQHDIGKKWLLYLASRYGQTFENLGIKKMKFHTTANTLKFDLDVDSSSI